MPKTNRLRDALLLAACGPAVTVVVLMFVAYDVAASLVELRRGDLAGLWGAS
jgi:hypothetical protein